jgi:hypothetical protein
MIAIVGSERFHRLNDVSLSVVGMLLVGRPLTVFGPPDPWSFQRDRFVIPCAAQGSST